MKTIGLIGGMSWESTAEYYRLINQGVRARLGGLHSARCVLWSFDFHEIDALQHHGDWGEAAQQMIAAARALERAGAEFLVLCTNTMHKLADEVRDAVGLPLLHIADATAEAIRAADRRTVGLLATRFTMEEDFYKGRLIEEHGLEVLVPCEAERKIIHDVIYNELCRGYVGDQALEQFRAIIRGLADAGAQGIVLGCTEIGLLVEQEDSPVPLFDTTSIHARAAVEFALA